MAGRAAEFAERPARNQAQAERGRFTGARERREFFAEFGDRLPAEVAAQLDALEERLNKA